MIELRTRGLGSRARQGLHAREIATEVTARGTDEGREALERLSASINVVSSWGRPIKFGSAIRLV